MNAYQLKSQATKARRTYPSVAQLAAGRKLINEGVTTLTADELDELAAHPYMASSQRSYFAELAAKLR